MDKKTIVKAGVDIAITIGTDIMLGGIGAIALSARTGISKSVGKILVPLAAGVYSAMLSEKGCKWMNEYVDEWANLINTFKSSKVEQEEA